MGEGRRGLRGKGWEDEEGRGGNGGWETRMRV